MQYSEILRNPYYKICTCKIAKGRGWKTAIRKTWLAKTV